MNMKKKEKEYGSLGEIAKDRNYKLLYDKLVSYEGTVDMKVLAENEGIYSELDLLLFNLPRFAKPLPKKETEDEIELQIKEDINTLDKSNELCPGFLDVIDIVLRNGGNPNATIIHGITPFMMACTTDNNELIKKMIDNPYFKEDLKSGQRVYNKADINKGDGKGNRPIFYATMTGSLSLMEYLVTEYNVDINKQYFLSENKTMLHQVCQSFSEKVTVDSDGLTFKQGDCETKEDIIDKLIELGANPTLMDDYENVPEELIPILDLEIHAADDISEEEQKIWEDMYLKVSNYRKSYENFVVPKLKF
jgi:hypothetical protein